MAKTMNSKSLCGTQVNLDQSALYTAEFCFGDTKANSFWGMFTADRNDFHSNFFLQYGDGRGCDYLGLVVAEAFVQQFQQSPDLDFQFIAFTANNSVKSLLGNTGDFFQSLAFHKRA
jgi:hypothetical protein